MFKENDKCLHKKNKQFSSLVPRSEIKMPHSVILDSYLLYMIIVPAIKFKLYF